MTPLLRPLLVRAAARALPPADRPMPAGEPIARVEGPDPDRVLLVGSGPVSGAGVSRHDDALPGALARALASRTAHGAEVEARGAHRARLEDVPALLQGARLQRFDALVLVVGLPDVAAGAGTRTWARALHRHLDALQRDAARDAVVVLARMPPFSSVAVRGGPAVALADCGVRRLNRAIEHAVADRTGTGCTGVPAPAPSAPLATREWYEACGDAFADSLAPLLAVRRGG